MIVLGAGEATPGINGAETSESICEMSISSSVELLAAANCSQHKIAPRSFPDFLGLGLRDGGLPFGRGDKYETSARVGKLLDRVGVVGSCFSDFFRGALIRGTVGVGADGDTGAPSMNSTSVLS